MADLITLDRLHELLKYDPETGEFTNKVRRSTNALAGAKCGCVNRHGYVVGRLDDRLYYMHRIAWAMIYGEWPAKGMDLDHIDGDKANNRIANLRLATRSQNMANRTPKTLPRSGHRGVHPNKAGRRPPWRAIIAFEGKQLTIGYYETLEEAVAARQAAEAEHFKDYRRGAHSCA